MPRLTARDHAIWFFNPSAIDRSELFKWIGDVKETVVAKYAARLGLVSWGKGT